MTATTIGYLIAACLVASLVYTLVSLVAFSNKFHWKFGIILTSLFGGLAALWPPESRLKLGIDLSGGTILVYQIRQETLPPDFQMEELIAALKRRVNPEGAKDIPIRPLGRDRVELILPQASPEEVDQVKRKLTTQGFLEFRILANRKHDNRAIEEALRGGIAKDPPPNYRWMKLAETITGPQSPDTLKFQDNNLTDEARRWITNRYAGSTVVVTGRDAANIETQKSFTIEKNTENTLTLDKPVNFRSITRYQVVYNPSEIGGGLGEENPNYGIREVPRGEGISERQILVKVPPDRMNVTGEDLSRVYLTEKDLRPAVGFTFDSEGATKFGRLTGAHLPEIDGFSYNLAIVLDGVIQSAPVIQDQIRDSGVITMGKSGSELLNEVDVLIKILQAGSLPGSLNTTPLQEEQIGPTLGRDTISKGINAIQISMLVVPIFMVLYYRLAGAIAVLALVLNMVLLLGSMALLEASFTLPGLAGFALTIGMSVDANVLIFERMREEAERGAALSQQIRNGFGRAWTAIVDSNVTTIWAGAVLWAVGTEEVKGFAITLIIGLIWNLFTAVFCTRVALEFLQGRGIRELSMLKLLQRTSINFTKPRYYCMLGSLLLIVIGVGAFYVRGGLSTQGDIYNIDFTGGTLVTIQLDPKAEAVQGRSESARAAFVRTTAGEVLPDPTVESLNVAEDSESGLRFNIRTTESDAQKVQDAIRSAFGANLARVQLTVDQGKSIPKPPEGQQAVNDSFAGGREYSLTFNTKQPPSRISNALERLLTEANIDSPRDRFRITSAEAGPRDETDIPSEVLVLKTSLTSEQADVLVRQKLVQQLRDDPSLLFERVENFGAAVAGESRNLALVAIIASWVIIIVYLWFRFKSISYGFAAVVALVHDVLVALGFVALSKYFLAPGYKIDLPMVAAFLTLIGFSVNDTIVIFDRIREIKGKSPHLTEQVINLALNQTLSRTILTTLTAFLVVVILYLFGGEGLAPFSFCLLVGFMSGTYSTIYIASPILIDWVGRKEQASKEPVLAA
jgi:SecD/SecF fusion protein